MRDRELPITGLLMAAERGHPAGIIAVVAGPFGAMPYFVARRPGTTPTPEGGDALEVLFGADRDLAARGVLS